MINEGTSRGASVLTGFVTFLSTKRRCYGANSGRKCPCCLRTSSHPPSKPAPAGRPLGEADFAVLQVSKQLLGSRGGWRPAYPSVPLGGCGTETGHQDPDSPESEGTSTATLMLTQQLDEPWRRQANHAPPWEEAEAWVISHGHLAPPSVLLSENLQVVAPSVGAMGGATMFSSSHLERSTLLSAL